MSYDYSVEFKGDYVEAFSRGNKNLDSAKLLWEEITRICEEKNCFKVLGIAESTHAMPILDSAQHDKLFRAMNISIKYKIAWVEKNECAVGNIKFLENFIHNRGLANAQLFEDIESAREWLLS